MPTQGVDLLEAARRNDPALADLDPSDLAAAIRARLAAADARGPSSCSVAWGAASRRRMRSTSGRRLRRRRCTPRTAST